MAQLALPLQLDDHAVFATFMARGNEAVVAALENLVDGSMTSGCWIWGPAASGKTHLLQAVCDRADDGAAFVPLDLYADTGPEIFDGLARRDLVCLDDLGAIAGNAAWEAALFALCNQIHDADGRLLVAAHAAPRAVAMQLPDLVSRLSRLPVFRLQPLDDADRAAALQLRARHRGLDLPEETVRYLLSRSRRDMTSLYELLDRLDAEALRAKRRLTIPFVRGVLSSLP